MARAGIIATLERAARRKTLNTVSEGRGGWWPIIREAATGNWQSNVVVSQSSVLDFPAVFACMTLIASDIAKLRLKLVGKDSDGIWSEIENNAYSPVLRRPNPTQNRIQFWENWVLSKLSRGNAYVLKARDARGVVNRLYVLDPSRVRPLVSEDGAVFYELDADNLAGVREKVVVPAREIIHDRMNCLYHPLVGVSPLYAAALAATHGKAIQANSTRFFTNMSRPGGMLLAAGKISDETASRLKAHWEANYSGENAGKIAVLGDGLKFEGLSIPADQAQLIEQLKWSAEIVCSVFHVPPYKIGVGALPSYNNVQALNVEYYSQALQYLIEAAELCMDEGLEMAPNIGTEFDLEGLLRMDAATQMDVLDKGKNVLTPNEARRRLDLKPVKGGDTVFRQQQDFSLEALAKRDAKEDPFGKSEGTSAAEPPPAESEPAPTREQSVSAAPVIKLFAGRREPQQREAA